MKLRELKKSDAQYMLEWMHDEDLVKYLKKNFSKMTIKDCQDFIKNCHSNSENVHLAIVDSKDEYMGTVSLKNIDITNSFAEFGICIRRCAMGTGIASEAMKRIISLANQKYNVNEIIWCVDKRNERAIRFYDKNKYSRIENTNKYSELFIRLGYSPEEIEQFVWYIE